MFTLRGDFYGKGFTYLEVQKGVGPLAYILRDSTKFPKIERPTYLCFEQCNQQSNTCSKTTIETLETSPKFVKS